MSYVSHLSDFFVPCIDEDDDDAGAEIELGDEDR